MNQKNFGLIVISMLCMFLVVTMFLLSQGSKSDSLNLTSQPAGTSDAALQNATDASIQTAATPAASDVGSNIPDGWKIYHNDEYGFEINYPSDLVLRERMEGDVDTFLVGFMQAGAQENLVSIEDYKKPEDFADLMAVKKSFKQQGYYIVLSGFSDNSLADRIISSFRFTGGN